MIDTSQYSKSVKQIAKQNGFDYCGIAKAQFLEDDAKRLEKWLYNDMHGTMNYMQNHFDLRINPQLLVPGAKSVITVLRNYFPSEKQNIDAPKISKYAFGEDYHTIIKKALFKFHDDLKKEIGDFNARGFVDSAPVLERSWAVKSGLGWVGKNGNVITKQTGSFFFIATLIVDVELSYDDAFAKDFCGSCTKCIDSCPTQAILPNKVVDGSKCISYFTIELKDNLIDEKLKGSFDNWMFGCDTCQDVCPWNRFSKPHNDKAFKPINELLNFSTKEWESLTENTFNSIFKNSPLKRSKFKGIQRNLTFLKQI